MKTFGVVAHRLYLRHIGRIAAQLRSLGEKRTLTLLRRRGGRSLTGIVAGTLVNLSFYAWERFVA